MSKVRVEHEEVFIVHVTNVENIPEKDHFDFNHKWVANNSDTKRIAEGEIKYYPII
jgi:hypothetical protein